jgi:AcrR family transcriptional regulator
VPRADRHEVTRHAIEQAAVHAFRVHGYAATTVDSVAAFANVSPRTVYRYYGSKAELFAETIAIGVARFVNALAELLSEAMLRDAFVMAFERTMSEANQESREMVRQAATDNEMWGYVVAASSRLQPALTAALAATESPGYRGAEMPLPAALIWEVRASVLLGAISTAFRRWAITESSDLSELVAMAVDSVLPVFDSPL